MARQAEPGPCPSDWSNGQPSQRRYRASGPGPCRALGGSGSLGGPEGTDQGRPSWGRRSRPAARARRNPLGATGVVPWPGQRMKMPDWGRRSVRGPGGEWRQRVPRGLTVLGGADTGPFWPRPGVGPTCDMKTPGRDEARGPWVTRHSPDGWPGSWTASTAICRAPEPPGQSGAKGLPGRRRRASRRPARPARD